MSIDRLVRRYRGLTQYKDKSDEELKKIVEEKEREREQRRNSVFNQEITGYLVEEQRKILIKLGISSPDEAPGLSDLLFLMGWNKQLQDELIKVQREIAVKEEKKLQAKLETIQEQIRKNTAEIRLWRDQLELDKKQKEGELPALILQGYLDRAKQYIQNHKNEFTWVCPDCGSLNLLGLKHWAFNDDKQVWSPELAELVDRGRLSPIEMARVLRTSEEAILIVAKERGKNWKAN